MPTTISGDDSNFPDEVQAPSDGDGPGIKAADVNPAFEGLMDRTSFLFKRGGRILAALGSVAAAPAADGDIIFVPYVGHYYFATGVATGNEDGLWSIRNLADTGTWFWEGYSLLAGETGSPFLADDGLAIVQSGKIGVRVIPNALVGLLTAEASINFSTTSNTFVDAHAEGPISVQTGDRLVIAVQGRLLAESGDGAEAQVLVSDPNGTDYAKECTLRRTALFTPSNNEFIPYSANCVHVAQATGDASVKVQIRSIQVGAHAYYQGHPTMIVHQVRP